MRIKKSSFRLTFSSFGRSSECLGQSSERRAEHQYLLLFKIIFSLILMFQPLSAHFRDLSCDKAGFDVSELQINRYAKGFFNSKKAFSR